MRAETKKERILSMVAAILVLIGGIGAGWSLAWLERQVNKVEITGEQLIIESRNYVEDVDVLEINSLSNYELIGGDLPAYWGVGYNSSDIRNGKR